MNDGINTTPVASSASSTEQRSFALLGDKVRVKPLEWLEAVSDLWWTAEAYRVEAFDGGGWAARVADPQSRAFRTITFGVSLERAKAAAQADYEARILASLDLSPAELKEEGASGWRYSINYGPDGEENWANLYTPAGVLVGNMPTQHARSIVWATNSAGPLDPDQNPYFKDGSKPREERIQLITKIADGIKHHVHSNPWWVAEKAIRIYEAAAPASPSKPEEGAWRYDLDAVPRDRDFLIQYDHKEVTLGHYLDNSKTQWPYEGIRPCRSMRPERVSEKIIAWRELPSPDTAGSSDPAVASPNGEHLRPLADREKSAASPVPEPQAVAWHWMAKNKMSTWPAWSLGPERPAFAPVDAIPLFAAAPLSGGDGNVTAAAVEAGRRAILKCRFYDCEPHMYDGVDAFFAHIATTDHWPEAEDEARDAITAALSTMGGKP